MNNIKNTYPRLKMRLFFSLLLIILSLTFISVFFFRNIKELNNVTNDIIEHPLAVNSSVRNIDNYINTIHHSIKDVVLSENETELNKSIDLVNKNEQLIYDNFKIVKERFRGNLEFANDAYTTFSDWKPIRDEIINSVKKGDIIDAGKITKGRCNDQYLLILSKTHKIIDDEKKEVAMLNETSKNIIKKAKKNFILLFISASVLSIILFLWIFFSISIPIKKMIERIKNILGDKIKRLPIITNNQLEILDYAIVEFENIEKNLEEKVNIRTKELSETKNIIENTITNSPIGMVEVSLNGKFQKANQAFCDTIGYTVKELKNLNFNDITVEEDKAIGEEYYSKALKGEISKIKLEKKYIHKSGRIIYALVSVILVHDINKKPLYFFSQISDITKQKEYEIELTRHENELENLISDRTKEINEKTLKLGKSQQALTYLLEDVNDIKKQLVISNSKLVDANKELEAFSYSVSHDLKAPLRAVIGFSQILKEDYAPQLDAESNRYIGLIKDNAENMGNLINDLLSFSRMGRTVLQKTELELLTIVQRIKSELMIDIKGRKVSINIMDMPKIIADEKLIYHVMLNLISNAVKFTNKVENAIVEIGCISKNNKDTFYVKDNGVGFNMKYAGRIFDVFQRLHTVEEFPGTGIGLSIVQRIIHKHGGKIWVESEINKGTTFFFTL